MQEFDTETGKFLQTQETVWILPDNIRITDIVLTKPATQEHQFRFYVNGESRLNDFFAAQLSPDTEGRLNWRSQNIVLVRGRQFQVKGAQTSVAAGASAAAEKVTMTIQYETVSE